MTDQVMELGTFEETRDGVPLKFKITTVPKEIVEDVIDHMIIYFLPREPLCSYLKIHEDPIGKKALRDVWRKLIEQGHSLVAIAEGPEPLKDRIVGVNVTFVDEGHDIDLKEMEDWGSSLKKVYLAVMEAKRRARIFEKYGIVKFLGAFGLSVSPDYHGYHIGETLLKCREPLCHKIGIKVTATIFTAGSSRYLSKKVGFKVEYEEEYLKFSYEGEIIFKDLPGKMEYSALAYN